MNGSSCSSTMKSCSLSLFTATSLLSVFSTGFSSTPNSILIRFNNPVFLLREIISALCLNEETDNKEVAVNNDKEQDFIVEEQDEPFIYNDGILTMDIIVNNKVDAMIGMDDITPYDFMR